MLTKPETAADVDTLLAAIRAKHPGFRMWDNTCGWVVELGKETRDVITGQSLVEVLERAYTHDRLPVVPPRPQIMARDCFSRQKYSGGWLLMYNNQPTGIGCKLVKQCDDAADKCVARNVAERDAWDGKYGKYLHLTAGVDFVWGW